MTTFLALVGLVVLGLVGFAVGLQLWLRYRVRSLRGKPAPVVPGTLGERIAHGSQLLVYFHSPGCAACRRWTPRLTELSRKNGNVQVVDVSRDWELARAFGVMATPSSVEIADQRIVAYYVGALPADLVERFAQAS